MGSGIPNIQTTGTLLALGIGCHGRWGGTVEAKAFHVAQRKEVIFPGVDGAKMIFLGYFLGGKILIHEDWKKIY